MMSVINLSPNNSIKHTSQDDNTYPDRFPVLHEMPSYEEFYRSFQVANIPCLIKGDTIRHWKSRRRWVQDGSSDIPSLEEFVKLVPGEHKVPVSDCEKKYFDAHECSEIDFKEFISYWKSRSDTSSLLYLKDWHFHREFPDYDAYVNPKNFASDWLNEFWTDDANPKCGQDDYRFVYIGPKGSWTPFHSDVFSSFSWSANVAGKKLWIILPPGHENRFRDKHGNLPHDIESEIKCSGTSPQEVKVYKVIQESGDIIFVPSNWYHQVKNMEDTISINHNWFNASNIRLVFEALQKSRDAVEKELADCRNSEDFNQICEQLLKCHHGMNFADFCLLLDIVARKRIVSCETSKAYQVGRELFSSDHAKVELRIIKGLIQDFPNFLLEENPNMLEIMHRIDSLDSV